MTLPAAAAAIRAALLEEEPAAKVRAARKVARDWRLGRLAPIEAGCDVAMPERPGRPALPELLPPGRMPRRGKAQSLNGRIALYHALAHIEFTAIDLALDMAGRFGGQMGARFTGDFLDVAADEAMHFVLLARRLRALGSQYGALPAHGGLWDAAHATRHDVAARLVIVPLVLEARALDVTPPMVIRLREAGDEAGARILNRILDDEIRHVRFGSTYLSAVAEARGESMEKLWNSAIENHFTGRVAGPFNDSARFAAGLSRSLYAGIA